LKTPDRKAKKVDINALIDAIEIVPNNIPDGMFTMKQFMERKGCTYDVARRVLDTQVQEGTLVKIKCNISWICVHGWVIVSLRKRNAQARSLRRLMIVCHHGTCLQRAFPPKDDSACAVAVLSVQSEEDAQ